MLYLALGAAALAFFVWLGRGRRLFGRREWRVAAGVGALAAFAAAAFLAVRGGWAFAPVLIVIGIVAPVVVFERVHIFWEVWTPVLRIEETIEVIVHFRTSVFVVEPGVVFGLPGAFVESVTEAIAVGILISGVSQRVFVAHVRE